MDERAALLRSILTEPDEDTHRLVYADYLDENGDNFDRRWADFIRRGVAYAASGHREPCLKNSFTQTDDGFWWKMCARWPRPLPIEWHWVGGFCMGIHLPCADFLENAASIFSQHPVTRVVLTDKRPYSLPDPLDRHAPPSQWGCRWHSSQGGAGPWDVPRKLYDHLPQDHALYSLHDDPEAKCYEWLSAACVAYGRALAKLPPLPPKVTA